MKINNNSNETADSQVLLLLLAQRYKKVQTQLFFSSHPHLFSFHKLLTLQIVTVPRQKTKKNYPLLSFIRLCHIIYHLDQRDVVSRKGQLLQKKKKKQQRRHPKRKHLSFSPGNLKKKKLQAQQLKKVQGPSLFLESGTWEEKCGELHKFNVGHTLLNHDMANCRYVVQC